MILFSIVLFQMEGGGHKCGKQLDVIYEMDLRARSCSTTTSSTARTSPSGEMSYTNRRYGVHSIDFVQIYLTPEICFLISSHEECEGRSSYIDHITCM